MRRAAILSLAIALSLVEGFSARAQDKPRPPTFGVSTDLVFVDFVVMSGADKVVGGLLAKDFVVKEDGKARPITSFAAFGGAPRNDVGPEDVVVEPGATAAEPLPKVSDAITVVFVDDGQMSPEEVFKLRPALKNLVNTIADRNGALALVAPWSKVSIANEVEGNRATFAAGVDKIQGRRFDDHSSFPMADAEGFAIERGDPSMLNRIALRFVAMNPGLDMDQATVNARSRATEVVHDARIRRADAYGVLLRSLDWLIRQPGRHSVVMVSGGFAYDSDDSTQQEVVTRSLMAKAPIHFVDARGLQGMGRFQGVEYGPALERDAGETPFAFSEAAEGASNLADDTGGLTVRNTNDFSRGLATLLDMTSTYYVLGYDPPEHNKPGFRKIKVEVLGKGLRVVARRGYFDYGRQLPPSLRPTPTPRKR